jgi:hypothetical protein
MLKASRNPETHILNHNVLEPWSEYLLDLTIGSFGAQDRHVVGLSDWGSSVGGASPESLMALKRLVDRVPHL